MSLLNITLFQTLISGFKYYSFNAYDFVQGDWMEMNIMNRTLNYPLDLIDSYNTTDGVHIVKYQTSVNNTNVEFTISSNTHVKVKYGNVYPEFEIDIQQKPYEVAVFDGYLPDGIYSMMTFYGRSSFELSLVFPDDKETIHTYGFFKQPSYKMNITDYAIIIGIALVLTYVLKSFMNNSI